MFASSPSNILKNSSCPSLVPFAEYKSLMFLSSFLFDTLGARALGIEVINAERIWSKKSKIVLSTSAYSNIC